MERRSCLEAGGKIYREIRQERIEESCKAARVAYQGEPGAFGHMAVLKHFKEPQLSNLPYFSDVFGAVEEGKADYGVVPIENTTEGSVNEVYDLLLGSKVKIVGEIVVKVEQCLIANPGVERSDVRTVYSHQQALCQCKDFLRREGMSPSPFSNTAASVKMIRDEGKRDSAAIASSSAAAIYGMNILEKGIQDKKDNYTRFVVLGFETPPMSTHDKTSLILSLKHEPGGLRKALELLDGINMLKIESRPIIGRPWEYLFYVDIEGHIDDPKVGRALGNLAMGTLSSKLLGSYPMAPEHKWSADLPALP